MNTEHLYAVVMAGGRGERLWPASRHENPKQLLPLFGDRAMIAETVQRLFPLLSPDRILVITGKDLVPAVRAVVPLPPENVIGEPVGRNTAPCVALAAACLLRRDAEATMIMLPSDHVIRPPKVFQQTLLRAAEAAQNGDLLTLGIIPDRPETGYGYMECGDPVPDLPGFCRVAAFREKPSAAAAEQFFQSGNYKWNSGIFIWRADAIARELQRYCPELGQCVEGWRKAADFKAAVAADFGACPKVPIDCAVLEKSDRVLVGAADFYWNDIGSWNAMRSFLAQDADGNATRGNVLPLDAAGNLILSDAATLIGVVGLNNIAVVKSGNGILVCALAAEPRLREWLTRAKQDFDAFL